MQLRDIKGKIDFAIITIRDDEFRAVLERFPDRTIIEVNRFYAVSQVQDVQERTRHVAIARCSEQGTGEAQNIAHDILNDLDPKWLMIVGIGGGVPDFEFTLGDVVLSTRVNDLTLRAEKEGRPTEYGISGGPAEKQVSNLITFLPAIEPSLEGWNSFESVTREKPSLVLDQALKSIYGDEDWKQKVQRSLNHHFGPSSTSRPPLFIAGAIDSSDTLVKDTTTIKSWLLVTRNALAVDMESAGVYRAASGKHYPFFSIRGISDIIGLDRQPEWTEYACQSAAAFTLAFIKSGIISPRDDHVTSNPPSPSNR